MDASQKAAADREAARLKALEEAAAAAAAAEQAKLDALAAEQAKAAEAEALKKKQEEEEAAKAEAAKVRMTPEDSKPGCPRRQARGMAHTSLLQGGISSTTFAICAADSPGFLLTVCFMRRSCSTRPGKLSSYALADELYTSYHIASEKDPELRKELTELMEYAQTIVQSQVQEAVARHAEEQALRQREAAIRAEEEALRAERAKERRKEEPLLVPIGGSPAARTSPKPAKSPAAAKPSPLQQGVPSPSLGLKTPQTPKND